MRPIQQRRSDFAAAISPLTDRLAGCPTAPLESPTRLTSTLVFRIANETLVVAVGPLETPRVQESALPWGLLHQGDRDLVLLLPVLACRSAEVQRWMAERYGPLLWG